MNKGGIDKIIELEIKNLVGFSPAEKITIKDALEGKLFIILSNGDEYELSIEEVKKLSQKVPVYLWSLVRIPFQFVKLEDPGHYKFVGSQWDVKAIAYIVDNRSEEREYFSLAEIEGLLKQYKTLIFITIDISNLYREDELKGDL